MRIGELARRTRVSISRIRFYEARGLLPPAPRTANGYRSYSVDTVAILHFIDQAQRLGFSLAEIQEGMPGPLGEMPTPSAIVAALRQKDAEIDRLIQAATAKKQAIASLLEELRCVG